MKPVPASQIAAIVGGHVLSEMGATLVGPSVVLDSRQASPGALFVAIAGDRVDGHDFAAAAAAGGASAALVAHPVDAPLAQIIVDDVPAALSLLARDIATTAIGRGLVSLALTGSSGKTTTKDMVAQLLEPVGPTVAPIGSYNSKLGLPVTVCAIEDDTAFLVAEMGASKIGHIAWLCSIAQPGIAAVLNVGHAHIGEFGSQEAIAQAKGEIVEALPASGWAVLNADDPLVSAMVSRTSAQIAWFVPSGNPPACAQCWIGAKDVRLDEADRASFTLCGDFGAGSFSETVRLRTMGAHQVANAVAAAALATCAGATPAQIASGLNSAVARSHWRMEPHILRGGAFLLNDAYNANPDSVAMALASVKRLCDARPGATAVAVLGDMLELGPASVMAHEEIGRQAAMIGAEVVAVGDFAPVVVAGARRAGGVAQAIEATRVADWLMHHLFDVVLIKGSRGIGLEAIVHQLIEARGEEA